jgi:hypothetical protein
MRIEQQRSTTPLELKAAPIIGDERVPAAPAARSRR